MIDSDKNGLPRQLRWTSASGDHTTLPAWQVFGCRPILKAGTKTTTTAAPTIHTTKITTKASNNFQSVAETLLDKLCGGAADDSNILQGGQHTITSSAAPPSSGSWTAGDIGLNVVTPTGILGTVLSAILGVFIR